MWAQFKDRTGDINDPENYIVGSAGSLPPWSGWRLPELWEAEGWRNDLPNNWIPPEPIKAISVLRAEKLQQIDTWTATAITSGFTSAATGITAVYDSTEADQQNIMLMLQAAQTADFAIHPIYKGQIPIRAVPEGQTSKVVLQHNAAQLQQVVIDMALHIGVCKQKGWQLQAAVAEAETAEKLEAIEWPE